ncbi:hypothetical protein [Dyadobacter fanqingshengii]|uniref:Uncharacterized protein n=1 Tax=Dyadobacter fanqingshengii TaxID=2906443 RepID=A0A9X1PCH4_9BACT|nr:hypothetical protein [Dyadobacter fanqingshengii]MCF0041398.1 hypothetical protein [Dyadobacter fanqingshengii]USJ36881.1 hypothetical protein NFI81_03710 [Dyadobacter fanqingshengii]
MNFRFTHLLYMAACWLSGLLMLAASETTLAQKSAITGKNVVFIEYPDFPDAHSTWGSIGYNAASNTVHIGVTNHANNIGLYTFDPAKNVMKLNGFIRDMANLRPYQWQGKIHSKIVAAPDGSIFFSTDGGESREEYLMEHPQGYAGGFFMKWNANTGLQNLGIGMQYESIKDVDIDPKTGMLYGITYPQAHFLVYNPAKNQMRDLGRLASSHVPRVLFTDWWGNCYYVDWRQRLVKYEKSSDSLVFARESLPAFPGTPGSKIITGITAFAKDEARGIIYLITYGAKLIAFYPEKDGIGKVKDLGGVIETGHSEAWGPYVPNLNIGKNGKLYYIIGGHDNYVVKDKTVLVEFDPATEKKTILQEYPITAVTEATGCDVRDKDGNLYFAARRNPTGQGDATRPFMIQFNPEKEIRK